MEYKLAQFTVFSKLEHGIINGMKILARFASVTFLLLLLAVPEYTFGQGLVPQCSRGEDNPVSCQFCDVLLLVNNVISWLVGILSVIGAIVMVYAGIQMVISGGNASAKERAKELITNVIIGYILVLAGWLLIDTGFKALLDQQRFGVWQEIQCVDQPIAVTANKEPIALGDLSFSVGRYALEQSGAGGQFGPNSGAGSLGSCQIAQSGDCSEAALRAAGFGAQASAAARIAGAESGCNSRAESRTDTTTDGRTYSVGTWQINLSVHPINCGGQSLNCPSAFREAGTRNRYNVREKVVVNESLYLRCVEAAKDPACNNQIAAGLASRSGDMGDWACSARKCGVNTSRNHLCPL